ncbi:MAG TPA: AraC family transcriptional regulator [Verrucomicrobiae bacterium]|nr:AraC family transcriptional regulator [Verrucomicrobiae bacterium]
MNTVETEPATLTVRDRVGFQINSRELESILKIDESVGYMLQHLNMPLQVATLAARVDLSKSHFTVLFKRYVGGTPIDYFIRLRLRQACHLLEDTRMSVKEIAYTLGYDDPFYFSRIFKSFNHIAPSNYRLRKGKTEEAARRIPAGRSYSRFMPVENSLRNAIPSGQNPT